MSASEAFNLDDGKQWRVASSLDGTGISTLEQTFRELIEILRSSDEIAPHLRDALAGAFERGQIGGAGVRARIEGDDGFFKALGTVASDKRLIDAGRHISAERDKGRSFESIYRDLEKMYGVTDFRDFGMRARKIFREFCDYCDANEQDIRSLCRVGSNSDFYYLGRAQFTEAKSKLNEKWPIGGGSDIIP